MKELLNIFTVINVLICSLLTNSVWSQKKQQSNQVQTEQKESNQELQTDKSLQNKVAKTNLNTIKLLTNSSDKSIELYVNSTKIYKDATDSIINFASKFNFNFKSPKFWTKIKYYATQDDTTEITNNNQSTGSVWVETEAVIDDPNWEGKTVERIEVVFIKRNITTIKNLIFTVDKTKTFNDLTKVIINAQQLASIPLAENHEIVYETYEWYYFKPALIRHYSIVNKVSKQYKGKFYVTIKVAVNDPNWEGKVERIKIELV